MADTNVAAPVRSNTFARAGVAGAGAGFALLAVGMIQIWEGLYTHAYKDVIGVKTVCYGHIENVKMGDSYTPTECKNMLLNDLPRYEASIQKCIHAPMSDGTHAALLSFTFNVGGGALCKSSVARKINAGDTRGGCDALLLYNRAGGRVIRGLTNRRQEERRLCLQ